MTEETTTEQLAEIDRDMADIERQVAELVEEAQQADYPQPEPVQVREGRWEMRGGHHVSVAPMAGDDFDSIAYGYTWRGIDWPDLQWNDKGVHLIDSGARSKWDLLTYLGPIEEQPKPQSESQPEPQAADTLATEYTPPEGWRVLAVGEQLQPGDQVVQLHDGKRFPTERVGQYVCETQRYIRPIEPEPEPAVQGGLVRDVTHLLEESGVLDSAKAEQQIEELRSEVSHVQNLLGESRQRVTQLEELVTSLRTINEGAEKAVSGAGVVNDSLRLQLAAVKAELASVAADRQRLQIELDAVQQVPPAIVDRFKEGWNQGTARAVEAIAEWLVPIRTCGSQALATAVISNLPHIMRSITGLNDEEIE